MPDQEANRVIPIFPLQRVVFPDSVLRLQIFEQRYLDMIARQLSQQQGFGVTLIKKGNEAGIPATPFEFGTYVEIVDFDQKDNGLLLITCVGQKRFRINSQTVMPDKLITANVSWLEPLKQRAMTDDQSELLHLLSDLSKHPQVDILDVPERWTELGFVLERLTEYMPITERQKQAVLEESDLDTRIAMLYQMLGWLA
ncbi:MAG TPA: LON peptidase substrate-binding domain-containing protein [Kangiella sp.]|uniref:LON peptidase substrate-binding domain-containing protein n=1 Tax=Kangiella sp. TaxID=1920245 RepID=UPI002F92E5E3